MRWKPAMFKNKQVWARVDDNDRLLVDGGRTAIRYSDRDGAKIYRGSSSGMSLLDQETVELDAGTSADAAKKGGRGASGFGSAGTRTQAQAAAAHQAATELVASFPEDRAVCFTDGACKGNPGPCGAGAVVRLPNGEKVESYRALGTGTNNVGELTAVGLAMDLLDEAGVDPGAEVELLTDSKYTHGVLTQGWKAKANRELILDLRARLAKRQLRIHWIAGHVGVAENERADELANMGVSESI